jgi:diguanylate cyclase (GGDEF)-like protein
LLALVAAGRADEAITLGQAALPALRGTERAHLLLALDTACAATGRNAEGLRAAVEACELFRAAGDRCGECDALTHVGSALRAAGDHAAAISQLEPAEALARELRDDNRLALVLRQIGISLSILGQHQQALSHLQDADACHRRAAAPELLEHLRTRLSLLNARHRQIIALPADAPERRVGLHTLAADWTALARDAQQHSAASVELMALGNFAIALREGGRYAEAIDALNALLPRYAERGMRPNEAICHEHLGAAFHALGKYGTARTHFEQALLILGDDGSSDEVRDTLEGLSGTLEALGDFAGALTALRRVRSIEQAKGDAQARAAARQRELRIELARLTSQWVQLAQQDPLTGLMNRRGLEAWIPQALLRAERGEALTVLLLDLDHFKSINDRFGHAIGDAVLCAVAQILRDNCRAEDLAVRYGGEEFLLALLGIAPAAAVDVAYRLRASVAAYPWHGIAPGLSATISIGVATAIEAAERNTLLALADRRLYAAKFAGRDRVEVTG